MSASSLKVTTTTSQPRVRPSFASPGLPLSQMVNPNADAATSKGQALQINTGAAKGLAEVLKARKRRQLFSILEMPSQKNLDLCQIQPRQPTLTWPVIQVLRTNLGPSGTMKM